MCAYVSDGIWELMIYTFIDNIIDTSPENKQESAEKADKSKEEAVKPEASKSTKVKMCGFDIGSKVIDSIMI